MIFRKMKYLLDVPKTIWFNFRALPFKKALRMPFFVGHTYRLQIEDYKVIELNVPADQIKPFMVRLANGGSADIIPNKYGLLKVDRRGKLIFDGQCQFNAGCSIRVGGCST